MDGTPITDPSQRALPCECHTRGAPEYADMTDLTRLDSDLLDLSRMGKRILPWRLSTAAAQDQATIAWASERAIRNIMPGLVRQEWGLRETRHLS